MSSSLKICIERNRRKFTGRAIEAEEAARLRKQLLPLDTGYLCDLMIHYPLAGMILEVDATRDKSGLGISLQWLEPLEIIREAHEAQPGIIAFQLGFVPVGGDLTGSGDPYFLRSNDGLEGRLYRIRHELVDVDAGRLLEYATEEVLNSLEDLFEYGK